jgi:hypothetical protein
MMRKLSSSIEGLGLTYEKKLNAAYIYTLEDLKNNNASHINDITHLGLARITSWQSMAELQEIDTLTKQYAEALVKSGITDLRSLSISNTDSILEDINTYKNKGIIPEAVDRKKVLYWQNNATELLKYKEKRPANLAPEVDIVWETMTCKSMRNFYESQGHPCSWFNGNIWTKPKKSSAYFNCGPFHAYDLKTGDSLDESEGNLYAIYAKTRNTIPELLSGCRKAPIMSVGLNPNLRGTTDPKRIYPYFDDLQQYAKHFRYRTNFKYKIENNTFESHLNDKNNEPSFEVGESILLQKKLVTMYKKYEEILRSFQKEIGLMDVNLSLGEDVSYYNFVACHSPRWNMERDIENGIVNECFHTRQFFLRQFRQSAPRVVIIFGKIVMIKFIEFFKNDFIKNKMPDITSSFSQILKKNDYVLQLDGNRIRIIFSPHPTGSIYWYIKYNAKKKIIDTLVKEYKKGYIQFDKNSNHLKRSIGPCNFCNNPIFKIGECSY